MKLKLNKEDTNTLEILNHICFFEYDHSMKMWEGWIKGRDGMTFLDKKAEDVYSELYYHIKHMNDSEDESEQVSLL